MPYKITLEIELTAHADVRAPVGPEVARELADSVGEYLLANHAHPSWCHRESGRYVTAVSPVPWVDHAEPAPTYAFIVSVNDSIHEDCIYTCPDDPNDTDGVVCAEHEAMQALQTLAVERPGDDVTLRMVDVATLTGPRI